MSETENTSETVASLLQEIEQQVATINRAKVQLRAQPDERSKLIRTQVEGSICCMKQLEPLVGQTQAIRFVVERYQNIVREE